MLLVSVSTAGCGEPLQEEKPIHYVDELGNILRIEEPEGEATIKEIDLGQFTITITRSESDAVLDVEIHLFGVVKTEHVEEFEEILEKKRFRLRHAVTLAIRNMERDDLSDPDLTYVKTELTRKINEVFVEPTIQRVGFFKFSFIDS